MLLGTAFMASNMGENGRPSVGGYRNMACPKLIRTTCRTLSDSAGNKSEEEKLENAGPRSSPMKQPYTISEELIKHCT